MSPWRGYDVFAKLFDPIIARRQLRVPRSVHDQLDISDVVVSIQASVERNIAQRRFSPAMTLEDRFQVEEILCNALAELPEEFAGQYFRLQGNGETSTSAPSRPTLNAAQEAELREEKWLFEAPDAPWILSSGRARHWPKARGIFLSKNKELAAWINDENHMRLILRRSGTIDVKASIEVLYRAEELLVQSLAKHGHHFAHSDRLGFLTTCPSDLGAALRAKLRSALPLLGHEVGFSKVTKVLGIQAKRVVRSEGFWDISLSSNHATLDSSKESRTAQVNSLIYAIHQLRLLERRLAAGEQVDLAVEADRLGSAA